MRAPSAHKPRGAGDLDAKVAGLDAQGGRRAPEPERSHDRDFVASMEKSLLLIEAFEAEQPRLTVADAARKASLTRAAARRYLLTLVALKYADTDGKYFWLTPRVLRLGYAFLSTTPLTKLAQPILDRVGEKLKMVTSLATLDDRDVVFIARSATIRRVISAVSDVGSRLPAYCTAAGRAMLAGRNDEALRAFLTSGKRRKVTLHTKTRVDELMAEIAGVRAAGYAISDEELEIGLRSIAVPVQSSRGEMDLSIVVSLLTTHMSVDDMVRNVLPELLASQQALEVML